MTTEEKYNFLESQSKGLFSQLMTFAAKRHFLDKNSLVDILDDDEINKITPEEQKILSEYIDDYVKYKQCDNLEGPTFTISKSKLFMIVYSNGNKEVPVRIVEFEEFIVEYV